jgi:inhibitor of cysteine peptidase
MMKVFLSMVLVLAVCMISMPLEAANKTVTSKDDEKLVTLNTGDKLVIKLPGNYTTGYQWEVIEGYDDDIIRQEGNGEYKPEKNDRVGAGGTAIFTFTAISTGRTDINLEYRRPWEKTGDVPEDFEITVLVKKNKNKGKKTALEQDD